MRITSKGQVTIPQEIRERCGLLPGTDVDFLVDEDGRVVVVQLDDPHATRATRGTRLVRAMRGALGSSSVTTDELMDLLRGYAEDADDPGFAPTKSGAA